MEAPESRPAYKADEATPPPAAAPVPGVVENSSRVTACCCTGKNARLLALRGPDLSPDGARPVAPTGGEARPGRDGVRRCPEGVEVTGGSGLNSLAI